MAAATARSSALVLYAHSLAAGLALVEFQVPSRNLFCQSEIVTESPAAGPRHRRRRFSIRVAGNDDYSHAGSTRKRPEGGGISESGTQIFWKPPLLVECRAGESDGSRSSAHMRITKHKHSDSEPDDRDTLDEDSNVSDEEMSSSAESGANSSTESGASDEVNMNLKF